MAKQSETRWIIVGQFGAYDGASSKRWHAIAAHLDATNVECRTEKRIGWTGLSELQKAVWKRCQENGDRAVKATLTWDDGL